MQQTSALYRRIVELSNHYFETTVVIGDRGNLVTERGEQILFGGTAIVVSRSGAESGYSESHIKSLSTNIVAFDKEPEVGRVVSQEIDLEMMQTTGDFPKMAVIIPYVRAAVDTATYIRAYGETADEVNEYGDYVSEWLQQGQFYIDTREESKDDDGMYTPNAFPTVKIHGYDDMMKAEQNYGSSSLDWPALDIDIVREIAGKLGVGVDSRTVDLMNEGHTLPVVINYSIREVLGFIAAKYLGFFIMSDAGELRLVTMLELPKETNNLIDEHGNKITFGTEPNEVFRILI